MIDLSQDGDEWSNSDNEYMVEVKRCIFTIRKLIHYSLNAYEVHTFVKNTELILDNIR